VTFPNADEADDEGLIAIGGDLSPERLVAAYEHGIFPWYDEGVPPLWWSPHPRAIIEPLGVHVSRSLRRVLKKDAFRVTCDLAFERVMRECGRRDVGTWIIPEMIDAYVELHRRGYAHSFEVWRGDDLVGGLYGVHRGALFAAESMFHTASDASKVALVYAARSVFGAGIELFDVQLLTTHLASMGAIEVSRSEYLARVRVASAKRVSLTGLSLVWDAPAPPSLD
jgi:leucyl/phenylalanyl-tRNA--protein transferase